MSHIPQIRQKLGISGISTTSSSWKYIPPKGTTATKGIQIELVIERGDFFINLCEMKFSKGKYSITKDYEETIRNRQALFREKTNCKHSLLNTFVTTFGVADGIHRSIVDAEIVAEDLFT